MSAQKVVMFVLCAHIYILSIKFRCVIFNGNITDVKENIFNTVGFIYCIKLLRYQNRLYHQTEKSITGVLYFCFYFWLAEILKLTLVLDKQTNFSLYTNKTCESFGTKKKFWNIL